MKKALIILLTVCLCVALYGSPISAGVIIASDTTTTGNIAENYTGENSFSGIVLNFAGIYEDDIIAIEVGAFNVGPTSAYELNLKYDPALLAFCDQYGDTLPTNAAESLIPGKITQEMKGVLDTDNRVKVGRDLTASGGGGAYTFMGVTANDSTGIAKTAFVLSPTATDPIQGTQPSIAERYDGFDATVTGIPSRPVDGHMHLYTMLFKLQNGAGISDLTGNSITLFQDSNPYSTAPNGYRTRNKDNNTSEDILFIGFPKATYQADMKFVSAEDSTPLEGASVTVKDSQNSVVATKPTVADGTVSFEGLLDGEYTYSVSKTGFENKAGSFTIAGANLDMRAEPIALAPRTEPMYNADFVVKDTKGNFVPGANIAVVVNNQSQGSGSTNQQGAWSCLNLKGATQYTYSVTKSGYVEHSGQFRIEDQSVTIDNIVLETAYYDISVKALDNEQQPVAGAIVYCTEKDSQTQGSIQPLITDADGIATFQLTNGKYVFTITKGGYKIGDGEATEIEYTVDGQSIEVGETFNLEPLPLSSMPKYSVEAVYNEAANTYTVTVDLENTKANGASFGLSYDTAMLKPATNNFFTMGDKIVNGDASAMQDDKTGGFHTFSWRAVNNTIIDATSDPVRIATYTFSLIDPDKFDQINCDTLAVQNFADTAEAVRLGAISPLLVEEVWREDSAIPQGGYYQGFYSNETNPADESFFDLLYEFDFVGQYRSKAVFSVIDSDGSSTPLAGVKVTIKDFQDNETTYTTDANGYVAVTIDQGEYSYRIHKDDTHWPNPGGFSDPDAMTPFSVPEATVLTFDIALDAKEFYQVTWDLQDQGTINGTATNPANARIVKDVDYFFTVEPAPGKTLSAEGPKAKIEGQEIEVVFDKVVNKYKIRGELITDNVTIEATFDEVTFSVTAQAGTGGTIQKGADAAEAGPKTYTETGIAVGGESQPYVFTANAHDDQYEYYIGEVRINGINYPVPELSTSFTYQFDQIDEDKLISVSFASRPTGSTEPPELLDTYVTVVLGEYGTADVQQDGSAVTITGPTRQDFLLRKDETFEMTVNANAADDYVIDTILLDGEVQPLGEDKTTADLTCNYNGENHLYVITFKSKDAEESIMYSVSSSIQEGDGAITPLGVKIYNAGSTPLYGFTPSSAEWLVGDVYVDDKKVDHDGQAYTFEPLDDHKTLLVQFIEKAYNVRGYVKYATEVGKLPTTPATVTFVRTGDKKSFEPVETAITENPGAFTASVPQGTYTITVKKPGYLNFTLTEFTVAPGGDPGNVIEVTPADKPIPILAGDASGDGLLVSFKDILIISSGFVTGSLNKDRADIDENGIVEVRDMTFAKDNYGKVAPTRILQDYLDNYTTDYSPVTP